MDFIQNQIDRGYTRISITNRALKGDSSTKFKIYFYNIETVEDYNKIVESPLHTEHPHGFSIGFMKP